MNFRDYDDYDYDPRDDAEQIPCPDDEMEDSEDKLESLMKKIDMGISLMH